MPSQRPALATCKLAFSALALAAVIAAPASANPRGGAPIVYKGDVAPGAAPARPTYSSPPAYVPQTTYIAQASTTAPVDRATARIEFRYPSSETAAGVAAASAPAATAVSPPAQPGRTEAPLVLAPNPPAVESAALQPMVRTPVQDAPAAPAPKPAVPADTGDHTETGVAIVYGEEFAGLPTANGETFSQSEMTAAHPSLPLPSLVHVTHLQTGREVVVRVNDRGPFEDGANLQLSHQAATALGFNGAGKGEVRLRYLGPAPLADASAEVSQKTSEPAVAPVIAGAPEAVPATPTRRDIVWPVAAEDELMGGATASAAPPQRLMSLRPEPAKSAPLAQGAATGDHYVQLASFTELGNAETLVRQVQGHMRVEIVPAQVNGADYFRVRVGPYESRDAAEHVRASLLAEGTADGRVVSGS